ESRLLDDPQGLRRADAGKLSRIDAVEHLKIARLERGSRRRSVVLDFEHDLVEVDVLLVVIEARLRHGDAVACDTAVVVERADAYGAGRELVAELFDLRRRQDHPGAIRELRDERRVRSL